MHVRIFKHVLQFSMAERSEKMKQSAKCYSKVAKHTAVKKWKSMAM